MSAKKYFTNGYFQPRNFYNFIETTRIGAGLSRALLRATIWRSSAQRLVRSPGRSTCPTLHPVLRSLKQRSSLRYFDYSLTKSVRKLSTTHYHKKQFFLKILAKSFIFANFTLSGPRRLIRSSRPTEIFQPPQQGFFSVHAQLQLLGNIFQLFTPQPTSPQLTSHLTTLTLWF